MRVHVSCHQTLGCDSPGVDIRYSQTRPVRDVNISSYPLPGLIFPPAPFQRQRSGALEPEEETDINQNRAAPRVSALVWSGIHELMSEVSISPVNYMGGPPNQLKDSERV